jgi:hypothetical protein
MSNHSTDNDEHNFFADEIADLVLMDRWNRTWTRVELVLL